MAKNAAYRWQNERKRGLLDKPKPKKGKKKRKRGITPKQAKYLASLQRRLRTPYTGNGMTAAEASHAIDDAKRQLREIGRLENDFDTALQNDASPASTGPTRTSPRTDRMGEPIGWPGG